MLGSCCNGSKEAPRQSSAGDIQILRFEQEMFATPADQLHARLMEVAPDYRCPLFNVNPEVPTYMQQVADMAQDPTSREIFDSICVRFPSLDWLQRQLSDAFALATKADGTIRRPKVITFASGMFDYKNRVVADEGTLLIALDQYVTPMFGKYGYFYMPRYLVALCDSAHLLPDCMTAVAHAHIQPAEGDELTMLDYMIYEGKALYFLDVVLPRATHDSVKIRYTDEQWRWAQANESHVWAYFVQHELLFEKDYNRFFNLVEDAPKSNAFGESAPRMTAYIGWQIVRRYMKTSGATLHELFALTDSQRLLNASGWKPARAR
ncbi:MAG: hypothetical protein IJ684_05190 [Bacteroidales bacterium]|nr:hypothetical protein [Bacteroidales bacterium]